MSLIISMRGAKTKGYKKVFHTIMVLKILSKLSVEIMGILYLEMMDIAFGLYTLDLLCTIQMHLQIPVELHGTFK